MKKLLHIICIVILLSISSKSFSQLIGGGLVVNPQTESFGLDLRAELPIWYIRIAPQFTYYPFFNKVTEYYAGLSINVDFMNIDRYSAYVVMNGSYNSWMNYKDSKLPDVQQTNWAAEFGIGLKGNKCISPFFEYRYNIKWHETNFRIGVLLDLECNTGKGYHSGSQGAIGCPGK